DLVSCLTPYVSWHGLPVGAASYRRASLEEANAPLTAADSLVHPQDRDPSSQGLERSTTGRLAGTGIFGVSAKGGPAFWRERSMAACSRLAWAFISSDKIVSRRVAPRNSI